MANESVPEQLLRSPPTKSAEAPPETAKSDARLGTARRLWYQAQEDAQRYNRNLLQYAGAIAAVLGIGSGSEGILAVANALNNTDGDPIVRGWVFLAVLVAAGTLALLLAVPLIWAFVQRGEAEARKANQLGELMLLDPDFKPGE